MVLFAAIDWVNTWLTPVWLLGLGALLGLAVLAVLWGLAALVFPAARGDTIPVAVWESPLRWILWVAAAAALFALVGPLFLRDTADLVRSVARVPFTGETESVYQLAPAPLDAAAEPLRIELRFRPDEIRTLELLADQDVNVVAPVVVEGEPLLNWTASPDETTTWDRGLLARNPFEEPGMTHLLAYNQTDAPARLTVRATTAPLHPQTDSVLVTAAATVAVFLLYLVVYWRMPKTAAIALATAKSEMAQPLFLVLLLLGFFALGAFLFIPYHTFGEDIKVLKNSGLTLLMVFAIFHALWAASDSVAEEIEGKTALTVLSKPIRRRQFIIGKFFGISWCSAVFFVVLGAWLLVVVAYKPIYDARESANTEPTWQECHLEMVRTVPGLFLAYLETLVFVALGVAISTRLPALANIMICFAIYAFGHLTPLLVQGSSEQLENVAFVARFIATILPVLDHFNIQAAIAGGVGVSYQYLAVATLYCLLYCTIAMLLALVLFEDRDLA